MRTCSLYDKYSFSGLAVSGKPAAPKKRRGTFRYAVKQFPELFSRKYCVHLSCQICACIFNRNIQAERLLQAVSFIGLPFCSVGTCRIWIRVFLRRLDKALQIDLRGSIYPRLRWAGIAAPVSAEIRLAVSPARKATHAFAASGDLVPA